MIDYGVSFSCKYDVTVCQIIEERTETISERIQEHTERKKIDERKLQSNL